MNYIPGKPLPGCTVCFGAGCSCERRGGPVPIAVCLVLLPTIVERSGSRGERSMCFGLLTVGGKELGVLEIGTGGCGSLCQVLLSRLGPTLS